MRKHLNLIQLSRAFVPIFVLLFHVKAFMQVYFYYNFLQLPDVLKSGGVYYFFALSGFMVYYLYYKKFGNQGMIGKFLFSRFVRIYPIYWIVTFAVLLAIIIFPSLGEGHVKGVRTFITSLLLIPYETVPFLGVAWSLVHTVLFYLVFTVMFFKNRIISFVLALGWALISAAFSLNLLTSTNYVINYLFNSNNLIFLAGVACAYIVIRIKINIYVAWTFVVLGMIGFPLSWINAQYGFHGISLELTTTLASILLILGFSSIDLQKDIKIPKLAQYLGDASFSIYLTHYYSVSAFTLILLNPTFGVLPKMLIAIILIITSIICGCIVYSFLEKPINRKLKSLIKKEKISYPELSSLEVENALIKDNFK